MILPFLPSRGGKGRARAKNVIHLESRLHLCLGVSISRTCTYVRTYGTLSRSLILPFLPLPGREREGARKKIAPSGAHAQKLNPSGKPPSCAWASVYHVRTCTYVRVTLFSLFSLAIDLCFVHFSPPGEGKGGRAQKKFIHLLSRLHLCLGVSLSLTYVHVRTYVRHPFLTSHSLTLIFHFVHLPLLATLFATSFFKKKTKNNPVFTHSPMRAPVVCSCESQNLTVCGGCCE
jgi:hypothetical protein